MRIIKLGLISFVVIFGIITLISFLFPSLIRLSKAINLPNHRNNIFTLLKNESRWHPAYTDSASAISMSNMQRTMITETDSTLVMKLQQSGRKPVINCWQIYGTPTSDSLTLQWYMDFQLSWYPWEKFSSLFYERTYGAMMEQGLTNLRKQLIK